ncbi:MAG: diphosphomevalonate decarboxylase [Sphingobacteriales bacterium]|nr:diphosphomevalonate decarboxylase [Sphingobacteriales bacterium]
MTISEKSGTTFWQCPSNIALIKYWGKYPGQLPANPSLSMTLNTSVTKMKIDYEFDARLDSPEISLLFNHQAAPRFEERIIKYLPSIFDILPAIRHCRLHILTENTFPHSAGIASSASGMGALALNLYEINASITGISEPEADKWKKISELARLASGSASRSVYGGWVTWGKIDRLPETSDLYASPLNTGIHSEFLSLRDFIIIVDKTEKKVSSSAGHALMNNHPYAACRYASARKNISDLIDILVAGDVEQFIQIVENEALTLHALMMQSTPSYLLLKPDTLRIIELIQDFREQNKIPLCFTLDAGPNIHLLFHENVEKKVMVLLKEISDLCSKIEILKDGIGQGPQTLSKS